MSSKGPILVTGLNGYLGAWTAETILKSGYPVRGTVRNVEAGRKTKEALVALGYDASLIEVVEIADMTAAGAFDKAVVGCSAVIHVAAPVGDIFVLPGPEVVRTATEATTSVVDSAVKLAGPQLQSIVLMSSTAAVVDLPPKPKCYDEKDWSHGAAEFMADSEAFAKADPGFKAMTAYTAGKTMSERAFWQKRDELLSTGGDGANISFTALQASWFIGPPIVPWSRPEAFPYSASFLTRVLAGEEPAAARMMAGPYPYDASVDVRDVARVIVWAALNPDKANGERFLCSGATGGAQAVADILDRASKAGDVPELQGYEVKNKGTPGVGYNPDYSMTTNSQALEFDGRKVRKATGVDYIPFEQSVLDTVKIALPVLAKA